MKPTSRLTAPRMTLAVMMVATLAMQPNESPAQDASPKTSSPGKGAAQNPKPTASETSPKVHHFSLGVADVVSMSEAGVGPDVIKHFVSQSKTRYSLTAKDIIALKEKNVSDEVTAAMLLRDQQLNRPTRVATPRIVQQLSTGGKLDPESYEFWQAHYLYPRTLSRTYKTLAPYAPQTNRTRLYGGRRGGYRFESPGPRRNVHRGSLYRGNAQLAR